jgi:hypothetical protein
MTERFGNVIYWGCCGIAGLWLTYAVVGITNGFEYYPADPKLFLFAGIGPSAAVWLIGRASKYILAGE